MLKSFQPLLLSSVQCRWVLEVDLLLWERSLPMEGAITGRVVSREVKGSRGRIAAKSPSFWRRLALSRCHPLVSTHRPQAEELNCGHRMQEPTEESFSACLNPATLPFLDASSHEDRLCLSCVLTLVVSPRIGASSIGKTEGELLPSLLDGGMVLGMRVSEWFTWTQYNDAKAWCKRCCKTMMQ